MRRACIQAVIEEGFNRALEIELPSNRAVEFRACAPDDLMSSGWTTWCVPAGDTTSTGYDPAAIHGRLLLRLCEAEAQLENYEAAQMFAERAAELGFVHPEQVIDLRVDAAPGALPSPEAAETALALHADLSHSEAAPGGANRP